MLDEEAVNWQTVEYCGQYFVESDDPILKKDSHRAEIIDVRTGLVVDDNPLLFLDKQFSTNKPIDRSDWMDCFSKVDWSKY